MPSCPFFCHVHPIQGLFSLSDAARSYRLAGWNTSLGTGFVLCFLCEVQCSNSVLACCVIANCLAEALAAVADVKLLG